MIFEIPKDEVLALLKHQLSNFFPLTEQDNIELDKNFDVVLDKCEENFVNSPIRYYYKEKDGKKEAYFDPFHTGIWMIFLYHFAHQIYLVKGGKVKDKIFYLNKIMNGCDIFYDVVLPPHFTPSHQVGTVIGRGKIGDKLYILHDCTIGECFGKWPEIGENCYMSAGSAIIGDSHVGDNVTLGAGCIVKNDTVPSNVNVFGESPNLIIKPKKV